MFSVPLDIEYNYLSWSDERSITLLTPPTGEPYVAIAELVAKVTRERERERERERVDCYFSCRYSVKEVKLVYKRGRG